MAKAASITSTVPSQASTARTDATSMSASARGGAPHLQWTATGFSYGGVTYKWNVDEHVYETTIMRNNWPTYTDAHIRGIIQEWLNKTMIIRA